MERSAIREAFRNFAGEPRYRKFVHALNTRCSDRLLFWQEKLWREFVGRNPTADLQFDALRKAFHVCEVHGCELASVANSDLPDTRRLTPNRSPFPNVQNCLMCRQGEREWAILPRAERAAVARNMKQQGST